MLLVEVYEEMLKKYDEQLNAAIDMIDIYKQERDLWKKRAYKLAKDVGLRDWEDDED